MRVGVCLPFSLCSGEAGRCLRCVRCFLSLWWKRGTGRVQVYLLPQREASVTPDGSAAARVRPSAGFGLSVALCSGSARHLSALASVSVRSLMGSAYASLLPCSRKIVP